MSKRDAFIDAARSQVKHGIYVWGGNGENLLTMSDPEAWIRKKETSKENADRAINLFRAREDDGIFPIQAFDCSGLVYWCQKHAGVGYGDKTANGYWKECEPVEETKAGDLVFHHNGIKCTHVGIFDEDGYVIESMGRDVGVVKSHRFDKNYWNRKGRLKKLIEEEPVKQTVCVIGRSVRVREGDGVGTKSVGIAHRGDEFPMIGISWSGWYQILYKGNIAYITSNQKYTKLKGV